jgi:hypothetical protein
MIYRMTRNEFADWLGGHGFSLEALYEMYDYLESFSPNFEFDVAVIKGMFSHYPSLEEFLIEFTEHSHVRSIAELREKIDLIELSDGFLTIL